MADIKDLIQKAQFDLDFARQNMRDDNQHDMVGHHLAKACEKLMKALCASKGVEYDADEHDLDNLMAALEESGFAAISSHEDLLALQTYESPARNGHSDRLVMDEYFAKAKELEKLTVREVGKRS